MYINRYLVSHLLFTINLRIRKKKDGIKDNKMFLCFVRVMKVAIIEETNLHKQLRWGNTLHFILLEGFIRLQHVT